MKAEVVNIRTNHPVVGRYIVVKVDQDYGVLQTDKHEHLFDCLAIGDEIDVARQVYNPNFVPI